MRSFIVVLFLALAGCGGGSTSAPAPSNFVTTDQMNQAIAEAIKTQAASDASSVKAVQAKVGELAFIGKLKKQAASIDQFRTMSELNAVALPSFGPCQNMGVFQGRGGSDSAIPLQSQFSIYKNCLGVFTAYNQFTGLHDKPPFVVWDGPNCTGNIYLETDIPQNVIATDVLNGGFVFTSPLGDGAAYYIAGGQTSQPVLIQSALNTSPASAGCSPDVETRMTVSAIKNDVTQSGVPDSLAPGSWENVAP